MDFPIGKVTSRETGCEDLEPFNGILQRIATFAFMNLSICSLGQRCSMFLIILTSDSPSGVLAVLQREIHNLVNRNKCSVKVLQAQELEPEALVRFTRLADHDLCNSR